MFSALSHVFVFFLFTFFLTNLAVKDSVYKEKNAFRHLYYSYGAYCNDSSLNNWNCKWCSFNPGFEVKSVVRKNYLQAYVGFDRPKNQIVVSFRGSHNIQNWFDNLDAISVSYRGVKGGEVHRGFYEAWMLDLYLPVMNAVRPLMQENVNASVLLNGHSLGGTLAQLAALSIYNYSIQINNHVDIICYSFGSPRWGNKVMADYFDDRIANHWRLTNDRDPVPNFPPRNLGYYHTSTQVWYNDDKSKSFEECSATNGEDPDCRHIGYEIKDHLRYLNVYESC